MCRYRGIRYSSIFSMEKFAWITNGLCVSFGGAPKPAFQGRQKELNVPSSLTDWSPNNCISNKQTTFLLLQHFFLWGLCCSTQRWRYKLLDEVSGQTGFSFQLDARRRKIAGSQHIGFCCKIISLPAAFSSDSRTGVSEGNFSNYTIVPTYRRKRDGIEEKQELSQWDSQAY